MCMQQKKRIYIIKFCRKQKGPQKDLISRLHSKFFLNEVLNKNMDMLEKRRTNVKVQSL